MYKEVEGVDCDKMMEVMNEKRGESWSARVEVWMAQEEKLKKKARWLCKRYREEDVRKLRRVDVLLTACENEIAVLCREVEGGRVELGKAGLANLRSQIERLEGRNEHMSQFRLWCRGRQVRRWKERLATAGDEPG